MIRLALLDDHVLVLEGIKSIVSVDSGIRVVYQGTSIQEFLDQKDRLTVDVLVLDLKFKLDYALSQISDIRRLYPDIEIVVLTMYEARYFALPLFKENIKAFLDKSFDTEFLVQAILRASRHECFFTQTVKNIMRNHVSESSESGMSLLTPRELEILHMILEGHSLSKIGELLFISVKTVSTHRHNILNKFGLRNNVELTKYCLYKSLI